MPHLRRAILLALACFLCASIGLAQSAAKPYAWRGLLVDTSRHMPDLDELRTILDDMHAAGLNTLQLHLTDGPGWRLEVPAYPRLTEVAAWRVDKTQQPWRWRDTEFDTTGKAVYGGYYTIAQLKALRAYALERGITIVPELDLPGHSAALLTAYPELACKTNSDPAQWLLGKDVICISSPKIMPFITAVLDVLCDIFPTEPIHIGCDEVPKFAWDACPGCRNPAAQKAFYESYIAQVRSRGHEVVAWDDLSHTGIDLSHVSLTCWHDDAKPREQDIACPYTFCYLDQPHPPLSTWQPPEKIRGLQINLWTEEMPTRESRRAHLHERLAEFAAIANKRPTTPQK